MDGTNDNGGSPHRLSPLLQRRNEQLALRDAAAAAAAAATVSSSRGQVTSSDTSDMITAQNNDGAPLPQQQQQQQQFTLPPDHFLSLPPTHANSSSASPWADTTASHVPPRWRDGSAAPAPFSSSSTSASGSGSRSRLLSGSSPPTAPAVNTATTASADFDVDVRTGFMPPDPAVERLPRGSKYDVWEQALVAARGGGGVGTALRLGGAGDARAARAWRAGVESMDVLSVHDLTGSVPMLRRAHLVLAFLLHFYVHTTSQGATSSADEVAAAITIPPSISVPLLQVCPLLGLPPILTYADTVLWNSHAANPRLPASLPAGNTYVRSLETFTNTPDEEHFYLTSARCELAGVEALALMRASLDEAFMADGVALTRLTRYLAQLARQIDVIGDIILDVTKGCDPAVFYHLIRPWFKGGDAGGGGWIFQGVDEETARRRPSLGSVDGDVAVGAEHAQHVRQSTAASEINSPPHRSAPKGRTFSGPSAGQSSLIHALDVFLMVDHAPTVAEATAEDTFMTRMLEYMPQPHRSFLRHLQLAPRPVRALVLRHRSDRPQLAAAYDEALDALKRLREKHMRIASLYIIQQARRPPTAELIAMGAPVPESSAQEDVGYGAAALHDTPAKPSRPQLAPHSLSEFIAERQSAADEQVKGTGGTALIKFLKMCRDNTVKTRIGEGVEI